MMMLQKRNTLDMGSGMPCKPHILWNNRQAKVQKKKVRKIHDLTLDEHKNFVRAKKTDYHSLAQQMLKIMDSGQAIW